MNDFTTKLEQYLSLFPDNATNWIQASDEIKGLCRLVRTTYNEMVINVCEEDPASVPSLLFKDFKTPSRWNKESKKQIRSLWPKLKDNHQAFIISEL